MKNSITQETKLTLFYILIAFSFSVAMRFIWVYQFSGYAPFIFHNQFMINTNDGYFWAEGARDLLSGVHQANDLSPVDTAAAQLTAFFAKILPFSFETAIFYMPVFLSSLVVIPIILIAKVLKNLEMGLIAAFLASIAWSYYNRTMAGYYDTDMLNIVLPMFLLWSIIWAMQTKKIIYVLLIGVDIFIYRWWYPQSYSLEFSFFGLILFYTLLFERKNLFYYKLLTMMLFAMMGLDNIVRLFLVIATYFIIKEEKYDKYIYYLLGIAFVTFFVSGGFAPILSQLEGYVFRKSVSNDGEGLNLHFFTVMQTVREAGHIPFETFANRISGHVITFVVSVIGYIYLAYKHRIMLMALPMIGLGFLASTSGLRFTIYAVPILAFGIAFLITQISSQVTSKKVQYLLMSVFTFVVLYPNYKHIDAYKVPTVFNATEVQVLDKFKSISKREDYAVGWWDYGYPIRYYADVKTLADGGKHSGSVNFPLSYILTHPQVEAAKMARLDVEYTEKSFEVNESVTTESNKSITPIEKMIKDYGYSDSNDFLATLQTDIQLPKKTRDIYFYLPYKMVNIFPTVALFSNLDLMTGAKKRSSFFFVSRNFRDTPRKIDLGRGVSLDKRTSELIIGKQKIQIKRFVKTAYNKEMKLVTNVKNINPSSNISVIYMSNYKTFLVMDEQMYHSSYIQLFVLEHVNKAFFEPVILNPNVKIYKLKI